MRKPYFSILPLLGLFATATLPAQNTNQDAPTAKHSLTFASGLTIELSYTQLTLAGGNSLKALMTEGEAGKGARDFYNDRYLPGTLKGTLALSHPVQLGGHALAKGSYGFTFRIDEELHWHLVVMAGEKKVADIVLKSREGDAMSRRLRVEPIAADNAAATGHLAIHYGPLSSQVEFAPAGADKPAKDKPSDSAPTSRPQRDSGR